MRFNNIFQKRNKDKVIKFLHTDKNNSYKYKSTKSNTPTLLHATSQQTKKETVTTI